MCIPANWKPVAVEQLQQHLGGFTDWTLCGGNSLDLILGRQTRPHGDIDIGVFRSQLSACLHAVGKEQVFLWNPPGTRVHWDGKAIDASVHDIWISDSLRKHWLLQIMVFDDEGEKVFYRRDHRISWPKSSHAIKVGNIRVLNPLITFLYKTNKARMEEKDSHGYRGSDRHPRRLK